jgi:DNA-binding NarL/FixJ family response regulator
VPESAPGRTRPRNAGSSLPPGSLAAGIIDAIAISVLVVDDDATFRRLAGLVLAAHGLKVVAEAGTVTEALAVASRVRPTAALVDVELPDGDGFDLAGRLTALPWRPRVVVTSVQSHGGFAAEAQRAGAEAFVPKSDLPGAPLASWLSGS